MVAKLRLQVGAAMLAAGLVLSACGISNDTSRPEPVETQQQTTPVDEPPEQTDESSPTETATPQQTQEATTKAADPTTEFSSDQQGSGNFPYDFEMSAEHPLQPVEVRVGQHEGYDRVVFEHRGEGKLSYLVEYEDEPTDQGQGAPVELDGEAYLKVAVAGLSIGQGNGLDSILSGNVLDDATGESTLIQDVHILSIFEGHSDYFIGLDHERDYRAFALDDPVRIVVDIEH